MILFTGNTCSLEKNLYKLDIFMDLSKVFDAVDHKVLITKSENYGVKGINLGWFKSYLENCKHFIGYKHFFDICAIHSVEIFHFLEIQFTCCYYLKGLEFLT